MNILAHIQENIRRRITLFFVFDKFRSHGQIIHFKANVLFRLLTRGILTSFRFGGLPEGGGGFFVFLYGF